LAINNPVDTEEKSGAESSEDIWQEAQSGARLSPQKREIIKQLSEAPKLIHFYPKTFSKNKILNNCLTSKAFTTIDNCSR
jgi:hypothetical protein